MIFRREPVAIVNAVRLAVLAAMTFGLSVSDAQLIATMAALEAALTLLARQQVTPNGTVDEHLDLAHRLAILPPADDVPTTGSPEDGVTYVEAAAISFLVCLVVLVVFF